MNARQLNLALWTAATLLTSGAVVAIVAGVVKPLESVNMNPPARPASAPTLPATEDVNQYAAIWSRPLRDLSSEPEAPTVAPVPTDGPGLTLAGTVGHTVALLRTSDGTIQVRAVGETLVGAKVVAIEPYKVTLLSNGKTVTLVKQKPSMLADRIR